MAPGGQKTLRDARGLCANLAKRRQEWRRGTHECARHQDWLMQIPGHPEIRDSGKLKHALRSGENSRLPPGVIIASESIYERYYSHPGAARDRHHM